MLRVVFVLALCSGGLVAADPQPKPVVVTDTALVLRDPIYFETGKAVIKQESYLLLDAVAATLATDPKLALIEIGVHTDERGADTWNREISQKRADAIAAYLVSKQIDARRLRAVGYGESRPLDKHHDEKAWAKNRRTEFTILQRIT
jgi:outer membrane protein OmpA-like peptidoglycan-associated protein